MPVGLVQRIIPGDPIRFSIAIQPEGNIAGRSIQNCYVVAVLQEQSGEFTTKPHPFITAETMAKPDKAVVMLVHHQVGFLKTLIGMKGHLHPHADPVRRQCSEQTVPRIILRGEQKTLIHRNPQRRGIIGWSVNQHRPVIGIGNLRVAPHADRIRRPETPPAGNQRRAISIGGKLNRICRVAIGSNRNPPLHQAHECPKQQN